MKDTELTMKLCLSSRAISRTVEVCKMCCVRFFASYMQTTLLIDNLLEIKMNEMKILNVMLPHNKEFVYGGGMVLEPNVGIYTNTKIHCVDFASLYPSIMVQFNLCFSTFIKSYENQDNLIENIKFRSKTNVIPNLLQPFINRRRGIKLELKKCNNETKRLLLENQSFVVKKNGKFYIWLHGL